MIFTIHFEYIFSDQVVSYRDMVTAILREFKLNINLCRSVISRLNKEVIKYFQKEPPVQKPCNYNKASLRCVMC